MKRRNIDCLKSFIGRVEPDGLNAKQRLRRKKQQMMQDLAEAELLQRSTNETI